MQATTIRKPYAVAFKRFDGVWVVQSRHDSFRAARRHCDSLCQIIPLTYHDDGRITYDSDIRSNPVELRK